MAPRVQRQHNHSDGIPSWEEITNRCDELNSGSPVAELSPDCMAALDAWFLPKAVTPSVIPDPNPVLWQDVFDALGPKVVMVNATLQDEACSIPLDDIRPDLYERCAARAMVELQLALDVCSNVDSEHSYTVVIDDWSFDNRGIDHYTFRVWPFQWRDAVDTLNRLSTDQSSYWTDHRRLLNARYRTAWTLAQCFNIFQDLPDRGALPPLIPRAARYGDTFAIANYPDIIDPDLERDADYLTDLLDHNPLQAFVHYANLYPKWAEVVSRSLAARGRAGLEKPLRKLLGPEMNEDAPIQVIQEELRRRSEFLRVKYSLAADYLAARMDVGLDWHVLNGLPHNRKSDVLDGNEMNLAQLEAERLVSEYAPHNH